jgi:predicted Zn-dependent protease
MKVIRVLVVIVASACATNPATGRRQLILMSESQEVQLGRQADGEIRQQMGVYDAPQLQQYVDRVGQRLARASKRPGLAWSFAIVDESAVNAFALPGGYVYLARGILPFLRDEAEMAAVLGHEIGHVDARHSAEAYSKAQLAGGSLALGGVLWPRGQAVVNAASVGLGLAFLKFGRDAELESDRLGVGYTAAAGWQPAAMQGLLNTLARLDEAQGSRRGVPNWALTHPPAADRVTKVQEAVAAAGKASTTTNREEFERAIDGVVFGDSREKGIVRGSDFLHPILRFALRLPDGWEITNSDEQLTAQPKDGAGVAFVLQLVQSASENLARAADASMTESGFRQTNGSATTINGLQAYAGTFEGTASGQRVIARAAFIRHGERQAQLYRLVGLAVANQFDSVESVFSRVIGSFRPLSQQEADRIQPSRMRFHVVRAGETWESIAKSVGDGAVKASTLAIMNGQDPGSAPRAGERIRTIVGG